MTKEEILAMRPGRDLDLSVYEMVLDNRTNGSLKPDSTDISTTWQVLKRLRGEYWCIEIKIADICWVVMELLRTPPIKVEVSAGTSFDKLPEAICKAALLAKLKIQEKKEEKP